MGIDPSSKSHGVAIFEGKKLKSLKMMQAPQIIDEFRHKDCLFSIENVCANKFVYSRNDQENKKKQGRVGANIGMCQQAQVELMRWLDHYGMTYVLHKPQKGNWADNKPMFEKATAWDKSSNRDTRSAAFFGYLEARN